MGNIGEELKKSLNKLGITRQVEAVGVVEQAQIEIAKYIPVEDFEVISFKNGILKIAVTSSVVSGEINLRKQAILKNLNRYESARRFIFVSKEDYCGGSSSSNS